MSDRKKLSAPPTSPSEEHYRFGGASCPLFSACVGFVSGAWAAGVLFDLRGAAVGAAVVMLFVGGVSSVFWVAAAEWFRRKNLGLFPALLLGAASPVLGTLPFGLFGILAVYSNVPVSVAFGVATSWAVHSIASARRPVPRAA